MHSSNMLQFTSFSFWRKSVRGFSLIEVAFVMMILGVLFVPIVNRMNQDNELADALLRDVEAGTAATTSVQDALSNPGKKRFIIEKLARQMLARGASGYFIAANFSDVPAILGSTLPTVPRSTFFNADEEFILSRYAPTNVNTLFLKTSDNQVVPLFSYRWELENISNNLNNPQSTSMAQGYYYISAKLVVLDVDSSQAYGNVRSVAPREELLTLTTNAHLKNDTLLQQAQQDSNNTFGAPGRNSVMVNFTLDLSEGSCYYNAAKEYNPRNVYPSWSGLDMISYQNPSGGRVCAPYFAPQYYTMDSGSRNTQDYDIYYNNGENNLFWRKWNHKRTETADIDAFAIGRIAQTYGEACSTRQNVKMLKPNFFPDTNPMTPEDTDTFPEGDLDYQAVNSIRCANYNAKNAYISANYAQLIYPVYTPAQQSCNPSGSSSYLIKVKSPSSSGEFVVEPIRMALAANYDTVRHQSQGALFGYLEPHQYISGAEYARSGALMAIFNMMQNRDASSQAHISLSINNHEGGATGNNTGNIMFPNVVFPPGTRRNVAPLYNSPDGTFNNVMQHLYSVNRRTSTPHLTGQRDFSLVNSLNKFNEYRKRLAMDNCKLTDPLLTDVECGTIDQQQAHRFYSHFFNIIFYMSDGTLNAHSVSNNNSRSWNSSVLNSTQIRTAMQDSINGAFTSDTTTLIIFPSVHAGMSGGYSLRDHFSQLTASLRNSGIDVRAYEVENLQDIENLMLETIVPLVDDYIVESVPAENAFYKIRRDIDAKAY
jgi:prepilin-type N-terminal cleavage/methylation domain-containing protein